MLAVAQMPKKIDKKNKKDVKDEKKTKTKRKTRTKRKKIDVVNDKDISKLSNDLNNLSRTDATILTRIIDEDDLYDDNENFKN